MASFAKLDRGQVFDQRGRRKYLTDDECARLLCLARYHSPEWLAACYVLAYTGCRISEALTLTIDQVDREQACLRLRTLKRRTLWWRCVPVPQLVIAALAELRPASDGRLLLMHRSTVSRHLTAMMRCVGIEGPMACAKGFRHGFGMRAAACSVPANLIQRWMGHASPLTTAIYLDAVGLEERAFAQRMWQRSFVPSVGTLR